MSTSNDMLKRIKSLQNEIQQIKEQEKSKGEWLESAESSLQKLSDSISQKTLSLEPSELRQLEQSTRGSMLSKFEKKPFRSSQSSVKSIKEYTHDPKKQSELQDELLRVQLAERKVDTVVSCCLESLKGYDEQYRKIDKVDVNLDGIVHDLQYRLEEAQRIGLIDQDLMNSNKNFSGKIDVVEVENLFECDGEIVC